MRLCGFEQFEAICGKHAESGAACLRIPSAKTEGMTVMANRTGEVSAVEDDR